MVCYVSIYCDFRIALQREAVVKVLRLLKTIQKIIYLHLAYAGQCAILVILNYIY